jgi:TonB family protein
MQVFLIFLLSAKAPPRAASAGASNALRLVTPQPAARDSLAQFGVSDPAQSALVSPQGYSGPTWLLLPRLDPGSSEWLEPPRWLTQYQGWLALPSKALTERPSALPPLVAIPPPTTPLAAPVAAHPVSSKSALRLEGGLQRRPLLNAPELPGWEFNDVLLPTVVQVVVDETGAVLNATLLSRSGLETADQRALRVARNLRFAAATDPSAPGLTWGTAVFQWHSTAPGVVAVPAATR